MSLRIQITHTPVETRFVDAGGVDAEISIYPDAAHGFPFQYPAEVAADIKAFLARGDRRAAP